MTKITVDKALIEQAIDALETYAKQYPHMWKGYLLDAEQTLRAALAEPAVEPVTRISLKGGKYLKLEPFYFLGPVCWILYTENDKQIRALDEFESGFVNAALNASPPPPAEVPLLTERELIDLFGGYGGLHTTQLIQFRIVEQAVRQKAGLK